MLQRIRGWIAESTFRADVVAIALVGCIFIPINAITPLPYNTTTYILMAGTLLALQLGIYRFAKHEVKFSTMIGKALVVLVGAALLSRS